MSFISAEKAYLMNFEEGNTLIWDPTDMEIIGEIPAPEELSREGFLLEGSPALIRGDRLYRSFNFVNYDDFLYEREGLLSQPHSLRRYRFAPTPAYLEPLTFLGVNDDFLRDNSGEFRVVITVRR